MLLGFVGCPSSGKTTTAALLFAKLKQFGITTEFIPEQARMYIAETRCNKGLSPTDPVKLSDEDQICILLRQATMESTLLKACGSKATIVTDSASYLSFIYMQDPDKASYLLPQLPKYDLLFYCRPLPYSGTQDPNRIHSQNEALAIDSKIKPILEKFIPSIEFIPLVGDPELRAATAIEILGSRMG